MESKLCWLGTRRHSTCLLNISEARSPSSYSAGLFRLPAGIEQWPVSQGQSSEPGTEGLLSLH